ncbi:MAG: hypothetical protein ACLFPD_10090, partial [Desulfosudaceae bacterium]
MRKKRWKFLIVVLLGGLLIGSSPALSRDRQVSKDLDQDGRIDQIVFFDQQGKITRLEKDSDGDGTMDQFQYYRDEHLNRVERDL